MENYNYPELKEDLNNIVELESEGIFEEQIIENAQIVENQNSEESTFIPAARPKPVVQRSEIYELEEMIRNCKTIPAKKSILTREIKALREYAIDVIKAYETREKDTHYGWLLGNRIFLREVYHAERNIRIAEKFKNDNFE